MLQWHRLNAIYLRDIRDAKEFVNSKSFIFKATSTGEHYQFVPGLTSSVNHVDVIRIEQQKVVGIGWDTEIKLRNWRQIFRDIWEGGTNYEEAEEPPPEDPLKRVVEFAKEAVPW